MHIKKYHIDDCWVKTEADKRACEAGYTFDLTEAYKVKNFIERYCPQSKGGWKGCIKLLDFQWNDLIAPFYGWYHPNGTPRYDSLYAFGARKWGKSFLTGACLPAYHLLTEPRSEVLVLASTVKQAKINYSTIANFAPNLPTIKRKGKDDLSILHVREHVNEIKDRVGKGTLSVLASTAVQGSSGWNTSLIVMDELLEWGAIHAQSVLDRLEDSDMAKRTSDGRKIYISTPQDDLTHPGKRLYDHAVAIKNGDIDTDLSTLAVVYSADPNDDPGDEATWKKAQPALGHMVKLDYYRTRWAKSKDSPYRQASFRTYLLGQWVGAVNAYIAPHVWSRCAEEYKEEDFYGAEVVGGFDFGGKYDLLAWVWIAMKDNKYYLIPRFALPEKTLEDKAKNESKDYMAWLRAGYLQTCKGDRIDIKWWQSLIEEDLEKFDVQAVAIDDYNMEGTRQWMEEDKGLDTIAIKTNIYNQITPLTSRYEALIREGMVRHNNNPLMNWNVENLTVRFNGDGMFRPDRKKGTAKIDGCAATIVGVAALEYLQQSSGCGILI